MIRRTETSMGTVDSGIVSFARSTSTTLTLPIARHDRFSVQVGIGCAIVVISFCLVRLWQSRHDGRDADFRCCISASDATRCRPGARRAGRDAGGRRPAANEQTAPPRDTPIYDDDGGQGDVEI